MPDLRISSILESSGDGIVDIVRPLDPAQHTQTQRTISYDAADPPVSIQLMTSLSVATYKYWKDTSVDKAIRQRKEDRVQPFPNILHIVQPTELGATLLTPFKL